MQFDEFDESDNFGAEGEEDLKVDSLDIFNKAVIWGTDWTTETVISQLKKKNIDLYPSFQRRDAWDDVRKSRLIESLILGLPVPPIILAERKDKRNSYMVIDGKQRLLTIRQFAAENEDGFKQLKLKGLTILNELNRKSYIDFVGSVDLDDYKTAFENQAIRTIVIKNWPSEEFLYTVFLRLNTGSKMLSPQELRQALHPGEFLSFIDEETSKSTQFMKLLRIKSPDSRMRDVELAIRYFAFKYKVEDYRGNIKKFLDDTCHILNLKWSNSEDNIKENYKELENAIEATFLIFGEKEAFSRYLKGEFNKRFNRALYDVFVYYFSNEEIRKKSIDAKNSIVEEFKLLSENDNEFNEAISSTTKDIKRTVYRFEKIRGIIAKATQLNLSKLVLEEGQIVVKD